MQKTDLKYVEDIIQSILIIQQRYAKTNIVEISEFSIEFDALIRRLQIIGEATKRVSDETKKRYKEIPWKQIAGTRDVIVHDYDGIDLIKINSIVKDELPKVLTSLQEIRNELEIKYFEEFAE